MKALPKLALAAVLMLGAPIAAQAQGAHMVNFYGIQDTVRVLPDADTDLVIRTMPAVLAPSTETRVLTNSAVVVGGTPMLGGAVIQDVDSSGGFIRVHPNDVSPWGLWHPNNWFSRMFGYMSE